MTIAPDVFSHLDELFEPWNRSDAPGLVVGIALRGSKIYRRGFGLASLEHGTTNTPATRMRIGSTGKHITSFAALLLVEEGKLDLERSIGSYLPELSNSAGKPTLRQLMNHTSGLRDSNDLLSVIAGRGQPLVAAKGAGLELAARVQGENFRPGERMIYCNMGYHLLSLAIERASGTSFDAFLRERIFVPLGMDDTESSPGDHCIVPRIATFHLPQADGSFVRGIYPSAELKGEGAIVSTVDDMLRWMAHWQSASKKIGNATTWQRMVERPRYINGSQGDYCLGIMRENYRGLETLHHAGGTFGCVCQMLMIPEHELHICIIANRMDAQPWTLALQVVDAVLKKDLKQEAAPLSVVNSALLGHWYHAPSRRLFSVVRQKMPTEQQDGMVLQISCMTAGALKDVDGVPTLRTSSHGTVQFPNEQRDGLLEIVDAGNREIYRRLPDQAPKLEDVADDLAGRYRVADLGGVEVELRREKNQIFLDFLPLTGRAGLALEPLAEDVFVANLCTTTPLPVAYSVSVSVARTQGRAHGLWLSGVRTRNLWLERIP